MTETTYQQPENTMPLDPSIVSDKQLDGWRFYVWLTWGDRRYARNANDPAYNATYFVMLGMAIAAFAFFYYFPFKLMGLIVAVPLNIVAMGWPVAHANRSPYIIWGNVMIGAAGVLSHWQFGFTLLGYHLEQYVFWGYLVGGLLAIYRRWWNVIIWKALDSIVLTYYRQQELMRDPQVQPIIDHHTAYHAVNDRLCALLKADALCDLAPEQRQQIITWLHEHTHSGLEKALHAIDQELCHDK